jgi:hypothetical protein
MGWWGGYFRKLESFLILDILRDSSARDFYYCPCAAQLITGCVQRVVSGSVSMPPLPDLDDRPAQEIK